jgi:2,4-dienoyl-CoA reductase-like NADH-dependent reductase (Old Yellow Enzyme family)
MKLLDKTNIGTTGKLAPNRIALAPMTNSQSNADGSLSDNEYNWLIKRAEGGFGMIITCASHVALDGQGWEGEMGIYDDKLLPGLKRLADGIHKNGALGIVQIFHGGSRSPEKVTGMVPWSSVAFTIPGTPPKQVRAGNKEDIERAIEDFINAAVRANKAGFDGVELHGAHGYLLHQFLSTDNNRTDEWGGSFENRIRLTRTVLQGIRKRVPRDFIVGVRLSPEDRGAFKGIDFDEGLETAKLIVADGADYIHISNWEALKAPEKYKDKRKSITQYYREALPGVTLMVAGEIWTAKEAQTCLEQGANLIAIGRCGIGNPDWPKHISATNYEPLCPPFSAEHLKSVAVSPIFVDYLRRWQNFVKS